MSIDIDILPGIESNLVVPGAPGPISVAALGSPVFDAGAVDPSTFTFGPGSAPPRCRCSRCERRR